MNHHVKVSSPIRTLGEILGLAVLYFATARLGQQLAIPPGNVTPVWIPSGIILVAVLLRGNAIWPGIWLGAFAGNVWAYLDWDAFSNIGVSLIAGMANGIGDTLCATIGAQLILRAAKTPRPFDSSLHVFQFILYGALVGGAISAIFGVTGLAIVGLVQWSEYMYVWVTWWIGDAVGVLLVAPVLLTLSDWFKKDWLQKLNNLELLVYLVVLLVVASLSLDLFPGTQLPLPLFMVLPILLWGVFKFPSHISVVSVVAVAVTAIILTALGGGPFAGGDTNIALIELQLFLFTIMTTIFVLVGMVFERRDIEADVAESETRYKRLLDQAVGGIIVVDENGCIESFNKKAEGIFGYTSAEVLGRNVGYLTSEATRNSHQQYFDNYDKYRQADIFKSGVYVHGKHKNQNEFPIHVAVRDVSDRGRRQFLAVVHDISDKVRLENQLKAREEEFKLLANASFDALIVINKNIVVRINDAFCSMFGYEPDELNGKPIKKKLFTTDLVFLEGQGGVLETEGINKHGARFPIEVQQKTHQINNELLKIISIRGLGAFKRQQAELDKARNQAINASRSKSRFLSAMSHELRTPMNAIIGFSQLLEMSRDNLTEQQVESVDEIRAAGKHLLGLIDDILDLSKIEAGNFVVSMSDIDIGSVVAECVELIKPLADNRGIKLFNHLAESRQYFVHADGFRLKQVLLNLLSNAVKYNHADGTVSVSCEVTASNNLRVSIIDSGVGLSEEDQAKVFEPFERVHAEDSNVEGTGIGLVITKSLVELMGGSIGVESYRYIGSTFWLELAMVDLKASVVVDMESLGRRTEHIDSVNLDADAAMRGKTLLYIEDEPANLRLVQQVVAKFSAATLLSAQNGALGIDLAKKELPDLILLDINLPGMDGYQVAKHLAKDKRTASIPIVGLSANALKDDMQKANDAGFVAYLTKPVDVELMMSTLEKYLEEEPPNT